MCDVFCIVFLFVVGAALLTGGLICFFDKWPVVESGALKQCEQEFMCPYSALKKNEVYFNGKSPLIATLVEGMPRRADTGKTVSYNYDGLSVSKSTPFLKKYSLVEGSKLQWEMVDSSNPVSISIFYERRKGCKKTGDCISYVEEKNVKSHSGQVQAQVSGKYTISIATNETWNAQISKIKVQILYWRYVVEDEEITHMTSPGKFILPDNLEQTSCVFVELPCSETLPPEKFESGEHYELKGYQSSDTFVNLLLIILGGLFIVAGIVYIIVLCCRGDNDD